MIYFKLPGNGRLIIKPLQKFLWSSPLKMSVLMQIREGPRPEAQFTEVNEPQERRPDKVDAQK